MLKANLGEGVKLITLYIQIKKKREKRKEKKKITRRHKTSLHILRTYLPCNLVTVIAFDEYESWVLEDECVSGGPILATKPGLICWVRDVTSLPNHLDDRWH